MMYITDKPFSLDMLENKKGFQQIGVEQLGMEDVLQAIAETSLGNNLTVVCQDSGIADLIKENLGVEAVMQQTVEITLRHMDEIIVVSKMLASVPDPGPLSFTHVFLM